MIPQVTKLLNKMKTPFFLATSTALLMPTLTTALVGISWGGTNIPATGLTNITFPFDITNTPHNSGYYFAQQFSFIGQEGVGHTGLQPRPYFLGTSSIRATFSSLIANTTPNDINCRRRANGGPGVVCRIDFRAPYAHGYAMEVRNTRGTTWEGTAVDAFTDRRVRVGSWTLPAGTRGIAAGQAGFVKYPPWDGGARACGALPRTRVAFGVPETSVGGVGLTLGDAYEYGDCVGRVAFEAHRTAFGVEVGVGF